MLSRQDIGQSVGTSHWLDHGWGSAPAGTNGVAATGYTDGSNIYEWVVYVGTDGQLNFGMVLNGGPIGWTVVTPPSGRTLSGHIAVTTLLQGTARYMFVGATTSDGHLYRFVAGVLPNLFGGWSDSSAGLSWLTDNPLAASSSPDATIASVFAAHTPGAEKLGVVRWNGSTWSTTNLGAPSGRRVCHSIASAQMSPTGLAGSERVLVACTPIDTAGGIDLAIATAYNTTSFSWSTYDTATFYQTTTAVAHSTSLIRHTSAIDVYGSELFNGLIEKGVYNGTTFSISSLGAPADVTGPDGGMGSVPYGTTSRMFFVSSQNGRNYLYERYGGSTSSAPQNYRAFGDTGWTALPGGLEDHLAEGKISIWQGTTDASLINRPGMGTPTDWPQVYFLYSEDENQTLHLPVQVPNTVNGIMYDYVSDPTTVVTTSRTMYSFQIGLDIDPLIGCTSQGQQTGTRHDTIYAVITTPASFPTFSGPVVLDSVNGNVLDHPYADIQHRNGQPDLIHVAWWNVMHSIRYSAWQDGLNPTPFRDIGTGFTGPPRVTASDSGRVIIYYGLKGPPNITMFCELWDTDHDGIPDTCCQNNGTLCGPSAGWQPAGPGPNNELAFSTRCGLGPLVSGDSSCLPGNTYIQDEYPVSMAISESGDTLYYCFDRLETSGPGAGIDADAFCTIGTRDPSTGVWSWNANPVPVAGVSNDGKDQFDAEVVLTQEQGSYVAGQETAIVTFYDRSDDPNNYYYEVKKAVSTDRMTTVFPARPLFGGIPSDPAWLPRHCFHPDARFIGDYEGSEGYVDHAQVLGVTVPTPGTPGTAVYSNFHALGQWEN